MTQAKINQNNNEANNDTVPSIFEKVEPIEFIYRNINVIANVQE